MNAPTPQLPSLNEVLTRLIALHPRRIDLTLDRMRRMLAQLGDPHLRIPPAIHVAGTNGKGSTIAFMRAILEAAGLRVHVYTSPHLVRINERVRLGAVGGGRLVSDVALLDALTLCESLNAGAPITMFEIETAAAFYLFAQHPADVTLLEVGLGGRLDATNVIEAPLAGVIAPIGIDHVEFLGPTLLQIAREKAGIIKPRVPVISAWQDAEATAAIESAARAARAPLFCAGQEWSVAHEGGRLVYQDDDGLLDLPLPRLFGGHQLGNAGLAIAALRAIKSMTLSPPAFEQGMIRAEWPARMQRLAQGSLLAELHDGAELWLDGGHNAHGGRAAAESLADLEERVPRPLVLIVGMLGNKDHEGFLANFAGLTRHVIAVPIPDHDNAAPPDRIADAARHLGMRVESATSVRAALRAIRRLAYDVPPRILSAGSLYLAGAVLGENGTPPQ